MVAYTSDVLIVGAGVGGLTLGLRLAAQGYRVRILQQREPGRALRPEIMQPAALHAFAQLGLLDRLKAVPAAPVERFHFHRIGGSLLCQVDYRLLRHPYPYALILLPHRTRHVILDGLRDFPGIHIHWDAQFAGLLRNGKQVIGAIASCDGREREFYAFVTVGADGSGSAFREALGIQARVKRDANAFLGPLVRSPSCAR